MKLYLWRYFALLICLLAALAPADVTLRIVVWDGDESLRVLRSTIGDFEKAHPGIKVKLENADYSFYFQKLLTQYAANTAPDVAMLDPGNFMRYAKRGALLDLNRFYDTPGFNINDYYKPIVDAHSFDGKLYVLPRDIAPMGLIYYNKRLFKEAGLDLPDGSWTWSYKPRPELGSKDFLTCMEKLTKKDASGKVNQWAFAPFDPNPLADTFAYSTGARYVDNPTNFSKLNYTDPRIIRALDFVSEISNTKHWMPSKVELDSVVQTAAVDLFIQQKLAMFQCGIWSVPHIRKAMKPGDKDFFDWDIAMFPGYQDPDTGKVTHAFPTGGSGYGILSSTAHPKEAWELARWMAGPPGMKAMAAAGIAQPAIQSLAVGPDWIPGPDSPPEAQYPHNRMATHLAVPFVVFPPTADYWPEINSIVGAKIDNVFRGTVDAKTAVTEGQALGEDRLKDILRQEHLAKFNWPAASVIAVLLLSAMIYWVFRPEFGKKLSHRQKAEARSGFLFASPWIFGTIVFTAFPMLLSLLMSATDWDFITPARSRGVDNFSEALFRDTRFWGSLKVTMVYTFVSVPLGITLSMLLALLLNAKIRGVPFYRTCFYLPSLASAVASSLIWRKVFQPDGGLLNLALFGPSGAWRLPLLGSLVHDGKLPDWLGTEQLAVPALIMMSFWGVGAGMIILLAGLKAVPEFYYEAATLDGAGPIRKFLVVTVPMVAPAILFTMITGLIGSFQAFTQVYVITAGTGGPNNSTRFFMLHLYDAAFNNLRMGYGAALAWILFVIIFIAAMLQFRLNRVIYYEGAEK